MIYDTFLFFNEFDLLDIRLNELHSVVDKFVLVEATQTHSNRPKPLHFAANRERYAAFHDKIIHIVVEDTPDTTDAWAIERFQRDCILRGLTHCRPDDLILMSDVDEIPRAEAVRQAVAGMRFSGGMGADLLHACLKQPLVTRGLRHWLKRRHPFVQVFALTPCIYFLNCICIDQVFPATRLVYYRDMGRPRDLRRWHGTLIPNGGWHFTCMGGVETLREKIAAFAHQEYNTPEYTDAARLEELIRRGEYVFRASGGPGTFRFVEMDATQPAYVLDHLDQFAAWIKPI